MSTQIFTQMAFEEFTTAITDAVKNEFELRLTAKTDPATTAFLTRKQTASLLGVSLPTLHDWTLKGKIPAYRIASRIRYKRHEVEQSLCQIDTPLKTGGQKI